MKVVKRSRFVSAVVLGSIIISGCAESSSEPLAAETIAFESVPTTQEVFETTAVPETTDATTTAATEPPTTTATVPETMVPPVPAAQMPNVVCMNLQDAQDYIQTFGVFYSRSVDATGQDRSQLIDSNWLVIDQLPAPGEPFGEGDALLFVVKYGEATC